MLQHEWRCSDHCKSIVGDTLRDSESRWSSDDHLVASRKIWQHDRELAENHSLAVTPHPPIHIVVTRPSSHRTKNFRSQTSKGISLTVNGHAQKVKHGLYVQTSTPSATAASRLKVPKQTWHPTGNWAAGKALRGSGTHGGATERGSQ